MAGWRVGGRGRDTGRADDLAFVLVSLATEAETRRIADAQMVIRGLPTVAVTTRPEHPARARALGL